MMMTISTSKRKTWPIIEYQWQGCVFQKLNDDGEDSSTWQEIFLKINQLKFHFYDANTRDINEAESKMNINVQDYQLNIQNINSNEGKSNLMILTNDEFGKIILSWKNFKEFYRVLDGLSYHGINLKKIPDIQTPAQDTLGIAGLIKSQTPEIGNRLTRRFSRTKSTTKTRTGNGTQDPKKQVRFSVESSDSETEDFYGHENFKKLSFEAYKRGNIPVVREVFEPHEESLVFPSKPITRFKEGNFLLGINVKEPFEPVQNPVTFESKEFENTTTDDRKSLPLLVQSTDQNYSRQGFEPSYSSVSFSKENLEKYRQNSFKYRGVVEAIQDSVDISLNEQIEKYKVHTVQSVDFFEAEEEKKTLDLQKLASFQKLKSLFKNRAGASEYEIEIKPREVVQEEVEVFTDEVKNLDVPALEIYTESSTSNGGQNNNNSPLEVFEPTENPVQFSPITELEKIKSGSHFEEAKEVVVTQENSSKVLPPLQRLRSLFKNRNLIETTLESLKSQPTAIEEVITHRVNVSIEPEIEHEYCVIEHKVADEDEKINVEPEKIKNIVLIPKIEDQPVIESSINFNPQNTSVEKELQHTSIKKSIIVAAKPIDEVISKTVNVLSVPQLEKEQKILLKQSEFHTNTSSTTAFDKKPPSHITCESPSASQHWNFDPDEVLVDDVITEIESSPVESTIHLEPKSILSEKEVTVNEKFLRENSVQEISFDDTFGNIGFFRETDDDSKPALFDTKSAFGLAKNEEYFFDDETNNNFFSEDSFANDDNEDNLFFDDDFAKAENAIHITFDSCLENTGTGSEVSKNNNKSDDSAANENTNSEKIREIDFTENLDELVVEDQVIYEEILSSNSNSIHNFRENSVLENVEPVIDEVTTTTVNGKNFEKYKSHYTREAFEPSIENNILFKSINVERYETKTAPKFHQGVEPTYVPVILNNPTNNEILVENYKIRHTNTVKHKQRLLQLRNSLPKKLKRHSSSENQKTGNGSEDLTTGRKNRKSAFGFKPSKLLSNIKKNLPKSNSLNDISLASSSTSSSRSATKNRHSFDEKNSDLNSIDEVIINPFETFDQTAEQHSGLKPVEVKKSITSSEPTIFSPDDTLSSVPISVPVQSKVILGYNKRLEKQIIAEKTAAKKTKKKSEEKGEGTGNNKNKNTVLKRAVHKSVKRIKSVKSLGRNQTFPVAGGLRLRNSTDRNTHQTYVAASSDPSDYIGAFVQPINVSKISSNQSTAKLSEQIIIDDTKKTDKTIDFTGKNETDSDLENEVTTDDDFDLTENSNNIEVDVPFPEEFEEFDESDNDETLVCESPVVEEIKFYPLFPDSQNKVIENVSKISSNQSTVKLSEQIIIDDTKKTDKIIDFTEKIETNSDFTETEDEYQDPEFSDVPEDFIDEVVDDPKAIDSDTGSASSDTTYYSVTSDIENNHRRVKFGPEFYYYKNIDLEEEVSEGTINEILEPEMSPLKKIKKLFKSNSSQEYDVNPGLNITTKYVDLPKISLNPLYDPAINVNPIYIDQDDEMKEELSPLHDEPRDVNLIETRFGDENETMKDEEFHDTTENIIEFGHEENVIPKRKRKPSVKIEMPQTEKSILEGYLDLTTSLSGRWRRRYVKLYPMVLYILPRITSTHATARVKLAKHRVEPHHHLTFGLAKRKKVTIWIKADDERDFRTWTKSFQMVIDNIQDLDLLTGTQNNVEDQEVIPKEEIMPVPTPRTIQPLTESDLHEDDHIPEDWKENNNNNENEEVHRQCEVVGSGPAAMILQRCKALTSLEESVVAQDLTWAQTIPEIPEDEETETDSADDKSTHTISASEVKQVIVNCRPDVEHEFVIEKEDHISVAEIFIPSHETSYEEVIIEDEKEDDSKSEFEFRNGSHQIPDRKLVEKEDENGEKIPIWIKSGSMNIPQDPKIPLIMVRPEKNVNLKSEFEFQTGNKQIPDRKLVDKNHDDTSDDEDINYENDDDNSKQQNEEIQKSSDSASEDEEIHTAHCEITNNQILVDENVAIHDSETETEDNDDDQSATTSSCSENHDDFTKNLNKNCQLTLPSSHSHSASSEIVRSTDNIEENIEFNIKDMKQFWEVATSPPINLISPTSSPISSPKSPQMSWKSMPNLAKDMATQTSIVEDPSSTEDTNTTDSSDENTEPVSEMEENLNRPSARCHPQENNLLISIKERKKAFLDDFAESQNLRRFRPSTAMAWKSMPSLNNKPSVTKSVPLPLVGSNYPSQREDIQIDQPVKQIIKQHFEVANNSKPAMDTQVTVPAAIVPIKLPPPPHLSLPKISSSRVRSSSVGSNDSSIASPTMSSSGGSSIINEEIQQSSSVDFTEKTTKSSFEFAEKTKSSFGFTEKTTKSTPSQPGPVIYRWDDESNGEIYTDRTLTGTGNNDNDEDIEHNDLTENNENSSNSGSSIGLYVVENGKEYPLLPISQRKSLFESNPSVTLSYKVSQPINNIQNSVKPKFEIKNVSSAPQAKIKKDETITKPVMMKKSSSHLAEKQRNNNVRIEPPVKSSSIPYILEEQEILQNIDLVSKIKTKFVS